MEAIRILMDEHQSLAAIIHAIRVMLHDIGAGKLQPDFRLFAAMVHYLDAYPEKRHHPKEDRFLFGPLKARTTDGAPDGLAGFATAFDAYAAFYRNHMLLEEREILPLIRQHFTADDWAQADAGFAATPDPLGGTRGSTGEEDFRRIFSKLVAAAPAPIGLGSGPYQDD